MSPIPSNPRVAILGGGLSGVAAAYSLARAGYRDITVVERGPELGGLAGSFERAGHFYPLGYHHILDRDRTLLYFLDLIGALPDVRWRKIRMLFRVGGRLYDLAHPVDFLRFPMSLADKARFARLMLRTFGKTDWSDWLDRSGADLVDAWGSPGVRRAIFEPLARLKFQLSASEVSGAWLGARLHYREGSAPFGYIPNTTWTKVLCDGVTRLLTEQGVTIRTSTAVGSVETAGTRATAILLQSGERIPADVFVSSIPAEVYLKMVPREETPQLAAIRYSALISVVCATTQKIAPDFYWMNLASLDRQACGFFLLSSLNPTIGGPGESCLNFVTHLQGRDRALFQVGDDELLQGYLADFRAVFGFDLQPFWTRITRIPMYSPVLRVGYRNPPVRSATWENVYFAGNYRTFPSIVSTGTALASGIEAADAILGDRGQSATLATEVRSFRLRSMPRA